MPPVRQLGRRRGWLSQKGCFPEDMLGGYFLIMDLLVIDLKGKNDSFLKPPGCQHFSW